MPNSSSMQFTGERFIPGSKEVGPDTASEHMIRYRAIRNLVRGKRVLDAACGEGYGSALIAESARSVHGVDCAEDAIKHASLTHAIQSKCQFQMASVSSLPFQDGAFDVVISFETIEHISQQDQVLCISEFKRVLAADGILIISTPNREIYRKIYSHDNHFHLHELDLDGFRDLLSPFIIFELYWQSIMAFPAIWRTGEESYSFLGSLQPSPLDEVFMIAVCGKDATIRHQPSLASISYDPQLSFQSLRLNLRNLDDHIQKLSAWGSNLANELNKQRLALTEDLNSQKIAMLEAFNIQKCALTEDINRHGLAIAEEIDLHESAMAEDHNRQKLEMEEMTDRIRGLMLISDHCKRIESSKGWRLIMWYRRWRIRLLAKGIRIRMFAQLMRTFLKNPQKSLARISPKKVLTAISLIAAGDREGFQRRMLEYATDQVLTLSVQPVVPIPIDRPPANASSWRKIILRPSSNPLVSIIIPAYNQWNYTHACLESLVLAEPELEYEVILADDASSDDTQHAQLWVENLNVIRAPFNLGFLRNCNHAAIKARGRFIYLLNNDTQLQLHAVSTLIEGFKKHADAGMIGSKLIYPDGRLQEAGGIVWKDGSAWNYGRLANPSAPEFNYFKEVDFCSGASLLIKADIWKSLGGFSEQFLPAYYEDVDLAFRVREAGQKVYYQPLSMVIHFEGISHGTNEKVGVKSHQVKNAKTFQRIWKAILDEQSFPNGERVVQARDRTRKRKQVLFIDHYIPKPDNDTGSRTIYQYIKLAVDLGFNVKFLGANFHYDQEYRHLLENEGVEILAGVKYRDHWQEWLAENGSDIAAIYLVRPHIAEIFIDDIKRHCKSSFLAYFCVDLHYLRKQREYLITKDPAILEEARQWQIREDRIMSKIDCFLTISDDEQKITLERFPERKTVRFPVYYWDDLDKLAPIRDCRSDFLFVGGFAHAPNVDGLKWFLDEVWPKIRKALPEARIHVVGSKAPVEISTRTDSGLVFHGFISDDRLREIYRSSRVVVVPLRYGAGVKGKTIEAMRNGVPIVATTIGIEGLPGLPSELTGFDDPQAFAETSIRLHCDGKLWMDHCLSQFTYIRANFSRAQAISSLRTALNLP